jgi:hypothetical protein
MSAEIVPAPVANLRDFIESDTAWWPNDIPVTGADHFALGRIHASGRDQKTATR